MALRVFVSRSLVSAEMRLGNWLNPFRAEDAFVSWAIALFMLGIATEIALMDSPMSRQGIASRLRYFILISKSLDVKNYYICSLKYILSQEINRN